MAIPLDDMTASRRAGRRRSRIAAFLAPSIATPLTGSADAAPIAFRKHIIDPDQAADDLRLMDLNAGGRLDILRSGQNRGTRVWYQNRETVPAGGDGE